MGIPKDDDPKETYWFQEYYDINYNKYSICYTKKQVEDAVGNEYLLAFAPFIPFHMSILNTHDAKEIEVSETKKNYENLNKIFWKS
jgi:hypothetical protein